MTTMIRSKPGKWATSGVHWPSTRSGDTCNGFMELDPCLPFSQDFNVAHGDVCNSENSLDGLVDDDLRSELESLDEASDIDFAQFESGLD